MEKIIKYAQWLDFATAFAVLAYGLYSLNYLWLAGGVIGLVIAFLAPARRVSDMLKARFLKAPVVMPSPEIDVAPAPGRAHLEQVRSPSSVVALSPTVPNAFARRRDAQIFAVAQPDGRNLARYLKQFSRAPASAATDPL